MRGFWTLRLSSIVLQCWEPSPEEFALFMRMMWINRRSRVPAMGAEPGGIALEKHDTGVLGARKTTPVNFSLSSSSRILSSSAVARF